MKELSNHFIFIILNIYVILFSSKLNDIVSYQKRYYRFFDVGARTKEQGTSENSRMYLLDNQLLQGKSAGGTHTYTVTEVRKNN